MTRRSGATKAMNAMLWPRAHSGAQPFADPRTAPRRGIRSALTT